ncbi:class I SAM-dependent methyltransferase [Rickettsiella endosymbiont of Dermanyssus gallinae]|uniref:class I SAM-dependent methyltransferase n=1 Tax=Rickettsiella endosymbiont of Dermanyssus gallinae TaxID=2856608 RepID=UPI001C531DCC|nr:class I SAM-dependent methyltransferase [Rickettsiella endosymbiont of Dermanyssus gallinae]
MNCRLCAQSELVSIIALGQLPLANAFSENKIIQDEKKYNLEALLCQGCGLVQLRDVLDPKSLFSHYLYFSSYSDTMLLAAKQLVEHIIPSLPENPFIIEIGSNDGYLLKNYTRYGISVLGIDPAENISKKAYSDEIPVLCDFFNENLAKKLVEEDKQADIIHANNVMAHIPSINNFIRGLKLLLKPMGYAIIEVPYFLDLINNLQFDTIYHEHVYYFSVKPLKIAFHNNDLEIFNIDQLAIHGGSLRIFVGHKGARPVKPMIDELITKEEERGLYEQSTYFKFMRSLLDLKDNLINQLSELKKHGKRIAAYGASAKGTTLLNFFDINSDALDFIVDRNPKKQGLYAPGTSLEVKLPNALLDKKIEYALLLTWNFTEEILEQQKAFREQGGKFIVPLPHVKTLG